MAMTSLTAPGTGLRRWPQPNAKCSRRSAEDGSCAERWQLTSFSCTSFYVNAVSCSADTKGRLVSPALRPHGTGRAKKLWRTSSRGGSEEALYVDDDDFNGSSGLVDAPVSLGDGFSFTGGKYSDEVGPADLWYEKGQDVTAYEVKASGAKVKEPLFGLPMGKESQLDGERFRWFYVAEGDTSNPPVLLLHGLPSQSYSFRKVLPVLAKDYRAIAIDWLGFGFSDKPQPKYGFDYSLAEYAGALGEVTEALALGPKVSIVAQGYFALAAIQYAIANPAKVAKLILINCPLTPESAKLPSGIAAFSTPLLGEIFAQDPLKASDKPLSECGPFLLDEEDAMVYRRPYLVSGMSGFALNAISRSLRSDLKGSIEAARDGLASPNRSFPVTVLWGMKDRWLPFKGVEDFCAAARLPITKLPEVGHHAQEDFGEEVGEAILRSLRSAF